MNIIKLTRADDGTAIYVNFDHVVAFSDDSDMAGNRHCRIVTTAPANGLYVLEVSEKASNLASLAAE